MIVVGHRGASADAPENTFAAFDLALAQGADTVETDIRATKDGVLVLMHDPTVDRTTDGHGAVADLTLTEIQSLDAGSRFGPTFAGQRVQTLDAFLQRYSQRLNPVLEIKVPGTEPAIIDLVMQHRAKAAYVSFHIPALEQVLLLDPEAHAGIITTELDDALIQRAVDMGVKELMTLAKAVTPAWVDTVHRQGLMIRSWGIPDDNELRRMATAGVDGVAVDWPARAIRALRGT